MKISFLVLLLGSCALNAQTGQEGPRPEWPCIAGRAVDPAYIETSESTGGQLFLFQKSEIGQAGLFLTGDFSHPATILRAVGRLANQRDWEFGVDSTVESLLVLASVQCRTAIRLFRPSGAEMTSANAAESVELQAGRALRIDNPEPGQWKLRLEGTGLFVASIRAKSPLRLSAVEFSNDAEGGSRRQPRPSARQQATVRVSGEFTNPEFRLVSAEGDLISGAEPPEPAEGGYQFVLAPKQERFRIRMTAVDASGWPVERTYPVLFRVQAGN